MFDFQKWRVHIEFYDTTFMEHKQLEISMFTYFKMITKVFFSWTNLGQG